jgi:hypothetical protein
MVRLVVVMSATTALLAQAHAQTMSLGGGIMTILPGTTMAFEGAVTWVIPSTGQVVNHGIIDLGPQAFLDEAPGSPISGQGTELATTETGIPLLSEPGGLGLRFTNNGTPTILSVVRGHIPFEADNGEPGIARWFMVDGMTTESGPWEMVMAYDDTELNGLQESTLQVHATLEPLQGWTMFGSTLDAENGTMSFVTNTQLGYVTAFAGDPSTGLETEQAVTLTVSQDLTQDLVFFQCSGHPLGSVITLHDATGRTIMNQPLAPTGSGSFSIRHLSGGVYVMQVEGAAPVKILRP